MSRPSVDSNPIVLNLDSILMGINGFIEVVVPGYSSIQNQRDPISEILGECNKDGEFENVHGLSGRVIGINYKGRPLLGGHEVNYYVPYTKYHKNGRPDHIELRAHYK